MRRGNKKAPLWVACGSSVEEGHAMFWALDLSDSRLFLVPERMRKDLLLDRLYDFLGKDLSSPVIFSPSVMGKRAEEIMAYIKQRIQDDENNGKLEQ